MQKELDERIRIEHGLVNVDLILQKILAFQVELAELANETRCFKYWSKKPPSVREVILEEYVDGIHFLLSIGLDIQTTNGLDESHVENLERNVTEQFTKLFELSSQFQLVRTEACYKHLFQEYIYLGKLLNFTTKEIEEAYIGKNEVNHQRQNEGY